MTRAGRVPVEQWRRNQYAVLVAVFISFLGVSFVLPFLPIYIRHMGVTDLGQTALLSGFAFAIAPLVSGFLGPVWGVLADRYGPKIMVQRALASFVPIYILMALVAHPWQIIALRLGVGLFGGFGPMTASLITIGAPQGEVGRAIGRLQATQILASAIGPLIGGVVADQIGIRASFYVTATLSLLAFVIIGVLYREEHVARAARQSQDHLFIGGLLAIPGFAAMIVMLLLAQGVDRGLGPIIPLFVGELDPGVAVASTSGLILSLGAFVSAGAASQAGRLLVRFGARRLLPGSLLLGLVTTAPLIFASQIWQLTVLRMLFGVASGITATLVYAIASQVVPQHSRSTAFSFLGSAGNVATAAGPLVAGALATKSLRTTFTVDTFLYAIAVALGLVVAARLVVKPLVRIA